MRMVDRLFKIFGIRTRYLFRIVIETDDGPVCNNPNETNKPYNRYNPICTCQQSEEAVIGNSRKDSVPFASIIFGNANDSKLRFFSAS